MSIPLSINTDAPIPMTVADNEVNADLAFDMAIVAGDIDVNSLNVSANGTYNAGAGAAYNPVTVSVPQTSVSALSVSANGVYSAAANEAFDPVTVSVPQTSVSALSVSVNGVYNAGTGNAFDPVIVAVPQTTVSSITFSSNGTYTAPTGTAYSPVTVDVSGITPTGTSVITANGVYDVTSYASASVSVAGGGGYTMEDIEKGTFGTDLIGSATYIRSYAFWRNADVETISFPNASTAGSSAFFSCPKLSDASLPDMEALGSYAFASCSALTEINLPKAKSIYGYAFANCANLAKATLPYAENLMLAAFASCPKLSEVILSAVTTMGKSVFFRNYRLVSLNLTGVSVVPTLDTSAFYSTPIGGYSTSAGRYGSIYVPSSLYTSFRTATNWSSMAARMISV